MPRLIAFWISLENSAASCSRAGMMSTVPRSACAIRRTSSTCQATPTPRQSHWNWPVTASMVWVSTSGVSCWFSPSVSRMACFWVSDGTVANTRDASRSQVPIAVPPSA